MATIHPMVTAARIRLGCPDACGCPVALAVAAELPRGTTVWAWWDKITINGKPYPTPQSVQNFVLEFDLGDRNRCAPFAFALEVEDAALERRPELGAAA